MVEALSLLIEKFGEKGILGLISIVAMFWAAWKDFQNGKLHRELNEGYKDLYERHQGLSRDLAKLIDTNYAEAMRYDKEQQIEASDRGDHKRLERAEDQDQQSKASTDPQAAD